MTEQNTPYVEGGRRRFLRGIGATTAATVAGCLGLPETDSNTQTDTIEPRPITGAVVTTEGDPIQDASIEFIGEGATTRETLRTDEAGAFKSSSRRPVWVRATHPHYTSQIRAVGPGEETTFQLHRGTVSLTFTGDVMFGRRFYEPNHDPTAPRAYLDDTDLVEAHREVLQYAAPLLTTADVTSVNLETALTTAEILHPTKSFTYTSRPEAAPALSTAGVDYTALGNNHVMDALEPGYRETVDSLDSAGLKFSGAGYGSDEAWAPSYIERDDLTIAYISCTTLVGDEFRLNWSADRDAGTQYRVEQNDQALTFPGDLGVAEPTKERLERAVRRAQTNADVVVVQIHGGEEYQREPTQQMRSLSYHAVDIGADLVVNHHPHVTGGIESYNGALIAWTLGNFVFDQERWATLRSYALNVDVSSNGVVRAAVEPFLLEGYLPKGLTGTTRQRLLQEFSGYSSGNIDLRSGSIGTLPVTDRSSSNTGQATIRHEGALLERERRPIATVHSASGTVRFARDRLPTGDFEDPIVDNERYEGSLWRYGRGTSPTTGPRLGIDSGGARLSRHNENSDPAFLSPRHRLPVSSNTYTLSLIYRASITDNASLLVGWYDDTDGGSFSSSEYPLSDTDNEWTHAVVDLSVPPNAAYLNFFLFLDVPSSGTVTEIAFDRIRLLEWLDSTDDLIQADHLYINGEATVAYEKGARDSMSQNESFDWRPVTPSKTRLN